MTIRMTRLILYVRDVVLLRNFYRQHFDLSVVTEEVENEWVCLDAGGVELALHRVGEAYRNLPLTGDAGSNAKVVFTIVSGLAQHRERLAAAGVSVRDIKSYEGFPYSMYDGTDPEGNVFQVMQSN